MKKGEFLATAGFVVAAGAALYAGINAGTSQAQAAEIPTHTPVSSPVYELPTAQVSIPTETLASPLILALSQENSEVLKERARIDAMIHSFPQSVYYWYDNGSMDRW